MTETPQPQYKPGDVVNGHVLTEEGQWVPVGAPPTPPAQPATGAPAQHPQHGQPMYPGQPVHPGAAPGQVVVVQQAGSAAPISSLISGLVGLFLAFIPLVGLISWLLGPIAIIAGIFGVRAKSGSKAMSWIGIVTGIITLVVCVAWLVVFNQFIDVFDFSDWD